MAFLEGTAGGFHFSVNTGLCLKCPYCGHEYFVGGLRIELWLSRYFGIWIIPWWRKCPLDNRRLREIKKEELERFFGIGKEVTDD